VDSLFDQYVVLVPTILPFGYLAIGWVIFATYWRLGRPLGACGKQTEQLGNFLSAYIHWIVRPLERAAIRSGISPNTVTISSMTGCAIAGVAVATGHFAIATWSYVAAGILDLVDGRLARATGRQTESGAFLDSVLDRWGEIFLFSGLAWQLQGSWALLATLLALGGSLMVSYTRARAESLGVMTNGGAMQRPERIILVSLGCLVAALADAEPAWAAYVPEVLGTTLAIVGTMSTMTAIGRLRAGYRMLSGKAPSPRSAESFNADDTPVPSNPSARVLRFRRGKRDRAAGGAS